jgi:hypothetical protein
MKADTYDAKVNRNVNITGLDGADAKKLVGEKVAEEISTNI